MSRAAAWAALLLCFGCSTLPPAVPLPPDDPAAVALLEGWRQRADSRHSLRAVARLAVDAPDAATDGGDLHLRARQRLWLRRPDRLRVEVLGLLDSTVAVLAVDGDRYALLRAPERGVERGPVHPGLLWDVARLDLSPEEAVALLLGVPDPDAAWQLVGAARLGEGFRLQLQGGPGGSRRVAEFGAAGELRRLEQRDVAGRPVWEARYADFVERLGGPFARELRLTSASGEARVLLRGVELNPNLPPGLFRLRDPVAEGG